MITQCAAGIKQFITMTERCISCKTQLGNVKRILRRHFIQRLNIGYHRFEMQTKQINFVMQQCIKNKCVVRAWRKTQCEFHAVKLQRDQCARRCALLCTVSAAPQIETATFETY